MLVQKFSGPAISITVIYTLKVIVLAFTRCEGTLTVSADMLLSMGGESTPANRNVAVDPSDLPAVVSLTDTLTPEAFL